MANLSKTWLALMLSLGCIDAGAQTSSTPQSSAKDAAPPQTSNSQKPSASYPAAGKKAKVKFGELEFALDFKDATTMSFVGLAGPLKGVTDTVKYTAIEVAPKIYMVYWHEPNTGANVVHVQDFNRGIVYTNIAAPDGSFTNLKGTLTLNP